MSEIRRCKNCDHYTPWVMKPEQFGSGAHGVCTAPRPRLGPAPNREVSRDEGANCPTWAGIEKAAALKGGA